MSDHNRPRVKNENYDWDDILLEWVPHTVSVAVTVGGATAANQVTGNTSLATIAGTVSAGRVSVSVDNIPSITGAVSAATVLTTLLYASGTASSSGNTSIVTPTAGKKVQLRYISYNPLAVNDVYFRFGVAGTKILYNSIVAAGSIITKDFGDFRYIEGAINEVLYINLLNAASTIWNIFYTEI